jgi:hypothetical protein
VALAACATATKAQDAPNQAQGPAVAAGVASAQSQPGQTNQTPPRAALVAAGIAPVDAGVGQVAQVTPGQATGWTTYRRLAELARPVDINLKDATVSQAAEALSRASGIRINVESIPRDLRLTVEAQHVPLKSVLEGIANSGDLMIGLNKDEIVLSPWPSLNVNGARTYYKGQYAPWGDEWGGRPNLTDLMRAGFVSPGAARPAAGFGIGKGQGFGGSGAPTPGGAAGQSGAFFGGKGVGPSAAIRSDGSVVYDSGQSPFASSSYSLSGGPFSMTALGDKLVIAERGIGPQGESSVILTVYQWDSSRQALRRISSTIHSAEGASRRPSRNSASGGRASGQGGNSPFRQNGAPAAPGGFFGGSGAGVPTPGVAPGGFNTPDPAPAGDEAPEAGPIKPGAFNMPDPEDSGEPL